MKRTKITLTILLIFLLTIFLGACTNKSNPNDKISKNQDKNFNNIKNLTTKVPINNIQNYTIDTKAFNQLLKPMEKGPMLERAKKRLGFSSLRTSDDRRLHLTIKTEQSNKSVSDLKITGNGFIRFGDDKFNFKINEKRSYLQQLDNDGQIILAGLIIGEIKNKQDSIESLIINTVYAPNTNLGQFGVVFGNAGNEISIVYGKTILDEKLINLIKSEVYNQK